MLTSFFLIFVFKVFFTVLTNFQKLLKITLALTIIKSIENFCFHYFCLALTYSSLQEPCRFCWFLYHSYLNQSDPNLPDPNLPDPWSLLSSPFLFLLFSDPAFRRWMTCPWDRDDLQNRQLLGSTMPRQRWDLLTNRLFHLLLGLITTFTDCFVSSIRC